VPITDIDKQKWKYFFREGKKTVLDPSKQNKKIDKNRSIFSGKKELQLWMKIYAEYEKNNGNITKLDFTLF
jgi:hypothetical protein